MLGRAFGFLGLISALLVVAAFLIILLYAGWHPGDDVGSGSPLHHVHRQATAITWVGIVACRLGTAMAVRTEHASLRSVGLFTDKPLLAALGFAMAFALAGVYLPVAHTVLGTEALSTGQYVGRTNLDGKGDHEHCPGRAAQKARFSCTTRSGALVERRLTTDARSRRTRDKQESHTAGCRNEISN
ncbi:cation transporting ATPase C-terminal domain-containing protein [Streptomyces sp. NBC_01478]|jgi:hypothetical protein|uniref:cation-translocating P-type ATPase C-terminal domain-containing protein n=1 Tax=Streptomyces sp. NBC_01478 TaxID=2903882 RepID=UPI002E3208DC|nr:cation-translocating P-type ATPase C-terminal domain-containing protein [Streptomyces sp. NBC_01478]